MEHRILDLLKRPYSGGDPDVQVTGIAYRSGKVRPGDAFFCIRGFAHDGHKFAVDAQARGAVAIVAEYPVDGIDIPTYIVSDTRSALATASAEFYGRPSDTLQVFGITGTNGKTTTTYLLDSVLRASGLKTGIIGTVETRVGDVCTPAARTTPESADLQALLAEMRDEAVDAVSIEVSSHAIDLHRADALRFAVAAFTNLTQDHLDYHHTMEEYFGVKKRLFTDLDVGARVINIDDPLGAELAAEIPDAITVGRSASADVRATEIHLGPRGAVFTLSVADGSGMVELPLAGDYNVSNALVAAGVAVAARIPIGTICAGLSSAPQVPGRFERIDEGQAFSVFVDYAHTPDGLEKAIRGVRHITDGRVIVVFGAGGDRDPDKRPLMGAAAARWADHVIVTSDNPRTEDPASIILEIVDGLSRGPASHQVEIDRRSAIALALAQADETDAVLIAGKGHEDYQIFEDRTIHFDDREVAREELRRLC